MKWAKAFLFVAVLALVAFNLPQRHDLVHTVSGAVTLAPAYRANSAATGTAVDLANYGSAMLLAAVGQADNGSYTSVYLVLQDSAGTSSGSWAAVDSVAMDSTDNSEYELGYTGANRYMRVIQRASGNAADTIASAVVILRGACRTQPC